MFEFLSAKGRKMAQEAVQEIQRRDALDRDLLAALGMITDSARLQRAGEHARATRQRMRALEEIGVDELWIAETNEIAEWITKHLDEQYRLNKNGDLSDD